MTDHLIDVSAPVAQWIERQPPELKAAGSNPAGRTIIILGGYEFL